MKINVGCGTKKLEGYISIDVRSDVNPDIVASIDNLPFPDNSLEKIHADDVLEHAPHFKTKEILKHWCDKLKPGGELFIQSPDFLLLCEYALNTKNTQAREDAIRRFFGGQDYPENTHMTSIDPFLINFYLKEAGFKNEPIKQRGDFGNRTNIRITVKK